MSAFGVTLLRLGALLLLGMLLLPLVGLVFVGDWSAVVRHLTDARVGVAVGVTLRATLVSLAIIVLTGTPLAWHLARRRSPAWLEVLVELPVVLPPAVIGVGLLSAFGRYGWLGATLSSLGIVVPFSIGAVVLAQTVVAAPFYIRAAQTALAEVDADLLLVAQTLGASRVGALLRVALPAALPGMGAGLALAGARAAGEFGATLLFAGNLPGRTQTLSLAIVSALERDVDAARAIAMLLAVVAVVVLIGSRFLVALTRRGG